MNPAPRLYGGIEAGGTKWVCAVADGGGQVVATDVISTTKPAATIAAAVRYFRQHQPLTAIGIGSFGPVDLRAGSPTYGHITTTPKPGWAHTDIISPLRAALHVPVGVDTDVNAAALGEWRRGAGRGLDTVAYMTVGTGIGVGAVMNGWLVHGLLHPEFGHIRIPHDPVRDAFAGSCPFHGDCLEGLASGEAMRQRWGRPAEDVDNPAAWQLEADYLAHAITNLSYTLSPEKIIVGGGVAKRPCLLAQVRARVLDLAAGYPATSVLTDPAAMDEYVVSPSLGDHSGIVGAVELARALTEAQDAARPSMSGNTARIAPTEDEGGG